MKGYINQIVNKKISEVKPYVNNPRKNDKSVEYVANSIKTFGFQSPIIIDSQGVIIAGHTRYRAAIKLKMNVVPCIVADGLTEEQAKAYRLADNKAGESSTWDMALLEKEIKELFSFDMPSFGFDEHLFKDVAIDLDGDSNKASNEKVCRCPKCGFEFRG